MDESSFNILVMCQIKVVISLPVLRIDRATEWYNNLGILIIEANPPECSFSFILH